ncbi:MAG: peptidoglycan-binding domain-containing protein [Pseudomonadota bacterium]
MSKPIFPTAVLAGLLLIGCSHSDVFELIPEEVTSRDMAPPGAPPGTCWGRDATPAVIETVTEQVVHEEDGTAPVYETQTSQAIVTPREDTWFERPCDDVMTPEFNASLQRALEARGHYRGPITGRMDGRTRAAIRAYQKPQGLDSGMISLAAARQMGLMQVDLNDAGLDVADVTVAELDDSRPQPVSLAPIAESPSAQAARLEREQAASRLAAIERAEEAERAAAEQATRQAEEDKRAASAARIAEAEAAEARRVAQQQAAQAEQRAATAAAEREQNKRAKELAQALEDEKNRTGGTVFEPLPISSESY